MLRIFVDPDAAMERELAADDGRGKLESRLNSIFLRINRMIIRGRECQREQDDHERRWKAEAARRAEKARRLALARKRRADLYREARQWKRAEGIRAYVEHIAATIQAAGPDDHLARRLRLWQSWAKGVVSRLDPAGARLNDFGAVLRARQHRNHTP